MKRATVILPDDIEQALEHFVAEQAVPVQLTAAVREYLGERIDLPSPTVLRIRSALRGSGRNDVSVSHDQYLSST